MLTWILQLDIVDGPLPIVLWILVAALSIVLLIRRFSPVHLLAVVVAVLAGAVLGAGAALAVRVFAGEPVPTGAAICAAAGFAALGLAIASFWRSRWWRRVVAVVLIVLALITTVLGVYGSYGINPTIGSVLGISTIQEADDLSPNVTPAPALGPLYQSWKPEGSIPAKGTVQRLSGESRIPSSAGFAPRDASIYFPPAYYAKNRPALPFLVFMMGQPGDPDPSFLAAALDEIAAAHNGLAPIAIVADQIGARDQDPVCADTQRYGGVNTYFQKDIPAFALAKLPILHDPKHWTIGGYSNGGGCAFAFAAEAPARWGNIMVVSGDEYPGVENPDRVVKDLFHGDRAAWEKTLPKAHLARHPGAYGEHHAVFTVGEKDPGFQPHATRASELARSAGWRVELFIVPGADHVVTALRGGIPHALSVLYPVWGLAPPGR